MVKLLCNSIPKSGTYLLASLAEFFGLQDQNIRFVDNGTNIVDENNELVGFEEDTGCEKFGQLKDGFYAPSHVAHSAEVARCLENLQIGHLFIYRHPLDVLYSYVRFVTYSKSFRSQSVYNRELQDRMLESFSDDEERLLDIHRNMKAAFNFERNINWLTEPACFAMSFEALYSALMEAEAGTLPPLLSEIANYVGYTETWSAEQLFEKVYGRGPTFAEGKNKIGQYKSLNKDVLKDLLKDEGLKQTIQAYGY